MTVPGDKRKNLLTCNSGTATPNAPTANRVLSSKARSKIPTAEFALEGRRYPIHDESHARNALARVSEYGTPAEKKAVKAAVHRKFPDIGEATRNQEDPTENQLVINSFQVITANFDGRVRHEMLEGRSYTVYPMTMLSEGVHAGSQGPLFYPAKELSKTPAVWDHKPIVINHPQKDGQAISACRPEVIENRKVGIVLNTEWVAGKKGEIGKLKAEAWIEPDRLQAIAPEVHNALQKRQVYEISTGLYTDQKPVNNGIWKGATYGMEASNFRPDHLAVLTGGERGACRDGGLLKNRKPKFLLNEHSHDELQGGIHKALQQKHATLPTGLPGSEAYQNPQVKDIYGTFCIYSCGGKSYKHDYSVDGNGSVRLNGKPEEVMQKRQYMTTDGKVVNTGESQMNAFLVENENGEQVELDREGVIDTLIDNYSWEEDDRDFLDALEDNQLDKIAENAGMKRSDHGIDTIDDEGQDDQSETVVDAKGQIAPRKGGKRIGAVAVDSGDPNPNVGNSRQVRNAKTNSDKDDALNKTKPKRTGKEKREDEEDVVSSKGSEPSGKGVQNMTQNTQRMPTIEQYIASAPPQMQDMLINGLQAHNQEKARLIQTIVANEANTFPKQALQTKNIGELRAIAALAQASQPDAYAQGFAPVANNYMGMGEAYVGNAVEEGGYVQEALPVPVLNFERKQD